LVDCTFLRFSEAVERVKLVKAQIIGFYSVFNEKTTLQLVQAIKDECIGDSGLFVVGFHNCLIQAQAFNLNSVRSSKQNTIKVQPCKN